jgi:hypothetical protein
MYANALTPDSHASVFLMFFEEVVMYDENDIHIGARSTNIDDTSSTPTFCWLRVDIDRATNDANSHKLPIIMTQQNFCNAIKISSRS